jgi:hypothetical protein
MGSFIQKWVLRGRDNKTVPEVDDLQSEYPVDAASGYGAWVACQAVKSVLAGVSAKQFHLKTFIIMNDDDAINAIRLYDGASTSVLNVIVAGSTTEFITDLKGLVFKSGVIASNLTSNIQIRVGGFLVDE